MAHSTLFLLSLLVSFSLAAETQDRPAEWAAKMQRLSSTFSEMMPELVSSRPPNKQTRKKLQEGSKLISELAHQIKMGAAGKGAKSPMPPDADPSLALMSSLFEREVKNASRALESGNIEYGKASLRLVTSYCISCHTRTDQGPQFPALPLNTKMEKLSRMERAQLFAATRQFDRALTEFEGVISDPSIASKRQIEWGRAVRNAFTIAVRVDQNPDRAMKIVSKVESLPSTPVLFRDFFATWKKSIQDWKKETKKNLVLEEEYYSEAKRLAKEAEALQKYPMDHAADVLYLRVTLAAHELLAKFPDGKRMSDTLLLLGNAYDLLDDHLISPLPEMYYETCIRRSPHTATAEQCFQRYEAGVYFGYTGSAGTSIPDDTAALMKELKALSKS